MGYVVEGGLLGGGSVVQEYLHSQYILDPRFDFHQPPVEPISQKPFGVDAGAGGKSLFTDSFWCTLEVINPIRSKLPLGGFCSWVLDLSPAALVYAAWALSQYSYPS